MQFLLIISLILQSSILLAYGGKPLTKPKSLPKSKALPIAKSLPTPKKIPIPKKIPVAKPLPYSNLVYDPNLENKDKILSESDNSENILTIPTDVMVKKRKKNRLILQEGVLDLTLNNESKGDIRIVTNETMDTLFLSSDKLLNKFEDSLMPEIFKQINLYLLGRKWVDQKELINMGIDVNLDINELIVNIKTPAKYRKVQTKQLGGTVVQNKTIDVQPSKRSAYITPYWSRTWRDVESVNNYVDLNAAVSFDGWVMDSDTTYSFLKSKHRRNKTRFVHDYPDQLTRLTLGDIEYKTIGLMGRKLLGGVSVSREFSLQPNFLINPVSHQRIFLENDSEVRIYVNDIPRQSFSLSAGYYDLQDFPLIDGINYVKIEITDIYGTVTLHEYTGFDTKKVLVPGVVDYSISTGVERIVSKNESTRYDTGEFGISLYARKGLDKNYTLGVLGEAENGMLSIGSYGVATGKLGTLEASSMLSGDLSNGNKFGAGISLNYYFATAKFNFNNTFYAKTENYAFLGKNDFSILQKYFYSTSLGMSVPGLKRWRQSYTARVEERWNGSKRGRASIKLSGRISKNYTLNSDVFYSINEIASNRELGVRLAVRWNPTKRMSVMSSYDSQLKGSQLDVVNSFDGIQGVSMNASLADNEKSGRISGGLNWKTQYFDTRYNASRSGDKFSKIQTRDKSRRYESFSLSNSFAYVDKVFAIGPPIKNGSFVIFKAGKGLGNGRISIAKSGDSRDREAMPFLEGFLSTALFTNLNQYGSSTAHLLPYLEDGYIGLEKRQYRIFGGYRSGALVNVTKNIKLYGNGIIANHDWEPITLIKGVFIHIETGNESRFFTDQEGYFEIDTIAPGEYRIIMDGNRGTGKVMVTATNNNYFDFGIISLKESR